MQPRPRGRAGAFVLVAGAIVLLLQAFAQGHVIGAAAARAQPAVPGLSGLAAPSLSLPSRAGNFWQAYTPPTTSVRVVLPGRTTVAVPILMYHYIRVPPSRNADPIGYGLSVTPADFAAQMDWLAANGYHPITIADIRLYLDGAKPLPDKPVALTFDDGYLDLYTTAFPILKAHRFTATAYIVSGFVGAPNRNVTSDEIVEMDRYGIEIGAHTFSHQDLTKVSGDRLDYELRASKQALETIVGHPVVDFCYPAGKYDASVIAAVEAAGYASATTTDEGVDHTYGDRFTWARVRVAGGESLADFARGVSRTETGVAITVQPAPVQLPRVAPILPGIFGDLR